MYGKHGLRLGNLATINDAILEVNGADQKTLFVHEIFSWAIAAEQYLYDCGISSDLAPGAFAVITTAGEPANGETVIGNKVTLRRAANDWRLMKISHTIRYPGDPGSFNVILTDRQQAVIGEAQAYAAAA